MHRCRISHAITFIFINHVFFLSLSLSSSISSISNRIFQGQRICLWFIYSRYSRTMVAQRIVIERIIVCKLNAYAATYIITSIRLPWNKNELEIYFLLYPISLAIQITICTSSRNILRGSGHNVKQIKKKTNKKSTNPDTKRKIQTSKC